MMKGIGEQALKKALFLGEETKMGKVPPLLETALWY